MILDKSHTQIHLGREVLYNFFYKTFINSPDHIDSSGHTLYDILEEIAPKLIDLADTDEAIQVVKQIKEFIKKRNNLADKELKEHDLEMARGYTRLMCLTDSPPAMESFYTSVDQLAMQESRDEVLQYYSDYKMRKSSEHNEHEDFISVEMQFLSYMANLTAEAIETNDKAKALELVNAQLNFINEHPRVWISKFVDGISQHKQSHSLHLPIGKFLIYFLEHDSEFLSEMIELLEEI